MGLPQGFASRSPAWTFPARRLAATVLLFASGISAFTRADDAAERRPGTHEQKRLITVVEQGSNEKLTTFAVDSDGRVLAGVAGTKSTIRVYDTAGEHLADWNLPVPPEAINVGTQGDIFVGGQGKLLRLDAAGKVTAEAAAPNMAGAKDAAIRIRRKVQDQALKDAGRAQASKIREYRRRLAEIEKKIGAIDRELDDLPESEKEAGRKLRAKRQSYVRMQAGVQRFLNNPTGSTTSSVKRRSVTLPPERDPEIQALVAPQMRIASISASPKEVFFACSSSAGSGFDVWRTDHDFANSKKIGEGLRGCCGQMDVQANANGVYVAENTRHKVRCFDRNGSPLLEFGSRERDGEQGFGGCCNPMNVNFGPNETVYTAEAGSGRVMRFSPDGKLIEVVGAVDLVPGCKKVSIAVSPSGDRVYMLDITRGHIVVMETKAGARPDPGTQAAR